jgi:hypothetical protein
VSERGRATLAMSGFAADSRFIVCRPSIDTLGDRNRVDRGAQQPRALARR